MSVTPCIMFSSISTGIPRDMHDMLPLQEVGCTD